MNTHYNFLPSMVFRMDMLPQSQHSPAMLHEYVKWTLVEDDCTEHAAAVGMRKGADGCPKFRPVTVKGEQLCSRFPDAVRASPHCIV